MLCGGSPFEDGSREKALIEIFRQAVKEELDSEWYAVLNEFDLKNAIKQQRRAIYKSNCPYSSHPDDCDCMLNIMLNYDE